MARKGREGAFKVHKCEFILASDLLEGLEDLWDMLARVSGVNPKSRNRTLVTVGDLLDSFDCDVPELAEQWEFLNIRCGRLPLSSLVDLGS